MFNKVRNRFHPGIWVITVIGFLNAAGFSLSLPFLGLYLYQERHLSMLMVGIVMLISGLGSGVALLFSGMITDKIGRRPLLILTVSFSSLFYILMAILVSLSSPVIVIAAMYTLLRSVLMMMRPPIQAYVADLAPKERLIEHYGLLRAGQNLGWAAGPAIGGFLAGALTYAWLLGVGGLILILALLCVLFFVKESFKGTFEEIDLRSMVSAGRDIRLLTFTLLCLLVFLVSGQMSSTLSVYMVSLANFTTTQYGFALTLNGLLVAAFQYPVSRFSTKLGHSLSLASGAVLYGVGYLIMAWVVGFNIVLLAMTVVTFGEVIFAPTTLAIVGEIAPASWRGRYMGFFGLSEIIGISLGPLLGGILLDVFPSEPILIWGIIGCIGIIAAGGFIAWSRYRKIRKVAVQLQD